MAGLGEAVLIGAELPEKEVGKCTGAGLDGLAADEERVHFQRAEIPAVQHPTRLTGLELRPATLRRRSNTGSQSKRCDGCC